MVGVEPVRSTKSLFPLGRDDLKLSSVLDAARVVFGILMATTGDGRPIGSVVHCSTADGAGHGAALAERGQLEVARAHGASAAAHRGAGDLEGADGVRVLEDGKVLGELGQGGLCLRAQGGVGGGIHDGSCGRDGGDLHGGVWGSHWG